MIVYHTGDEVLVQYGRKEESSNGIIFRLARALDIG